MSSLATGLIGGLVGAIVGALLEGYFGWRTHRRQWIQDVRREVYVRAPCMPGRSRPFTSSTRPLANT